MKKKRITVIFNWPEPEFIKNIQTFFKFINFYRKFICAFARIAYNLTEILKDSGAKTKKKQSARINNYFSNEARKFFRELVKAFTTVLLFRHFNWDLRIRLEINVFNYVISGIFFQLFEKG